MSGILKLLLIMVILISLPLFYLLTWLVGIVVFLILKIEYHNSSLPELIDNQLVVSYEYFTSKFNISRERIRKAFVRLEALNIISRSVCNIVLKDGSRNNRLFISINLNFFDSCFRNPDLDIRVSEEGGGYARPSPLTQGNHISNKNLREKNRSIKSNFFEKDFSRSDTQNTNSFLKNKNITAKTSNKKTSSPMKLAANHSISQNKIIKKNTDISKGLESEQVDPRKQQQTGFDRPKTLEEFYPLVEEDVCLLQKESGRKFDIRAMNEILKNMAKKLTKPKFFSKKGFIAYMSKAFRYEMRDAVKINNNTFQIKANLSNDEKLVKEQEAFLCKVEYSLEVNPEWHLRKKLAAVLERDRAYNILTSWRSCKRVGDSFRIYLTKPVELSAGDRKIIHQAVLATQVKNDDEILLCIEQTEIITIKEEVVKDMSVLSSQSNKQDLKRIFPDNAWGRLRESMMVLTGMVTGDAIALDKSWFSILEANIDDQRKQIKLQAPTKFINDWIESNYLQLIEKAAKNIGYSFAGVEFSGN